MLIGCLDFETTGLNPVEVRICEIGLQLFELESGKIRLEFERRINPTVPIPPKTTAIHGISNADVMTSPTFASMAPGFLKLVQRCDMIIGHNIERYDCVVLAAELARCGVEIASFPHVFDTMLKGRWATDDGKVPNLGELCYALEIPYDKALAHGALYDVSVNAAAFRKGWQLGYFKDENLPAFVADLQVA